MVETDVLSLDPFGCPQFWGGVGYRAGESSLAFSSPGSYLDLQSSETLWIQLGRVLVFTLNLCSPPSAQG